MNHLKKYDQFVNEKFLETRYSAGLAIIYDGKVLLGHSTGRKPKTGYGISKGGIEEGETNLQAAIRETKEEFGIKVPTSLIDKNEHTFLVTSRKYKYNKVVYYYIVKIDKLSQIGLKELKVPKGQLQLKEVDKARFMDKLEATKYVMLSQTVVLQKLTTMGLI
jgi:8-oxo-dGTP pyrophosphatase MutT (NUDIX family)